MAKGLRSGLCAVAPPLFGVGIGALSDYRATRSGGPQCRLGTAFSSLGRTEDIVGIATLSDASLVSDPSLLDSFVCRSPVAVPWNLFISAKGFVDPVVLNQQSSGRSIRRGFSVPIDFLATYAPAVSRSNSGTQTSISRRSQSACRDSGSLQSPAVAVPRHAPLRCPRSCAANRVGAP